MFAYKPSSYYFEEAAHREYFTSTRHATAVSNALTRGVNIHQDDGEWVYDEAWTEVDEVKLVDKLYMTWFGEHYNSPNQYPELNLDALEAKPLRKNELRPFKIEYSTYAEIKLRLNNTLISIKGHPYTVQKVVPAGAGFGLVVHDGTNFHFVKYKDLIDLRSIPAKYVAGSQTGWLCRWPGRVYQQGLNRSNTQIRTIDGGSAFSGLDIMSVCKSLRKEQDRKWAESFYSLLRTQELNNLRLTDDVAVTWDGEDVLACYRGRKLGTVQDDTIVVMDEDDLLQGWIEKAAAKAGFSLSA